MSKCIIIDGHSLAYRAYYGVPALSAGGVPTNALYGFLNMLSKLLKEEQPTHVAVAFDAGGKVFRNEHYTEYKANRAPMPDDLRSQIALIQEALTLLQVPMVFEKGYEGDDVIGTLSRLFSDAGVDTAIVTGDRDTFQLVDEHTVIYYTRKGLSEIETVDLAHLESAYQLKPDQVVDLKGLMGDSSDNIPGVPGIGAKTAHKLLDQYGSLDAIYAHLEDFSGKKMGEKLETYKAQAYLSRDLATIHRQVPLQLSIDDLKRQAPHTEQLRDFYQRYELKNLLRQLGDEPTTEKRDISGRVLKDLEEIKDFCRQLTPGRLIILPSYDKNHKKVLALDLLTSQNEFVHLYTGDYFSEIAKALEPLLNDDDTHVLTDDAKELYCRFYLAEVDCSAIFWDAALTDYLLHPEERDHSLDTIIIEQWKEVEPEKSESAGFCRLDMIDRHYQAVIDEMKERGLWQLYATVELPLAFVLAEMEVAGVAVQKDYLQSLDHEFSERIADIEDGIYVMAGQRFNLNSPKQLGKVLFEDLGLTPLKKTKTGYSTSAEVLEALKDDHGIIGDILEYRQLAKLKSTYVDGLLAMADASGKVHTTFNQTLTATGRLSSSEPNLQNIPVRTEEGMRIRKAFVPSELGQVLVSADYSQIELRILAHMSQDETLIKSFTDNEDIHLRTASEVFHTPIDQVTKSQRRAAKAVNFGIIYGQTDYGLARELGISRKEAQAYIDRYFERYPGVQAWIQETISHAREAGYVRTLLGRRRTIKDIQSKNFNLRNFAERTAVNTPIQGSAADIIKLAMLACDQRLRDEHFRATMVLQVHDELIFETRPEEAAYLIHNIRNVMENVMPLTVPLQVDVKVGFNWQEMENVGE